MTYDRSQHSAACGCDGCCQYDAEVALQENPRAREAWHDLSHYINTERAKNLNWDFPVGHCILCGGTNLWAYYIAQHFEIGRHNTVQVSDGTWYTSLLLHKTGSMFGVYKRLIALDHPRERVMDWASGLLALSDEKCTAVATRDFNEEWFEIRLAFTDWVNETYVDRSSRIRASSCGYQNREDGSHSAAGVGEG